MTPEGWNTWEVAHINAVVHLPSKWRVHFGLYDPESGEHRTQFGWREVAKLGMHSADGSYAAVALQWDDAIVELIYASEGDAVVCWAIPENAGDLRLTVEIGGAWNGDGPGPDRPFLRASAPPMQIEGFDFEGMIFALTEPVMLSLAVNDMPPTGEEHIITRTQRAYADSRLRSGGWLEDAADGLTRAIHWNTIWEPQKGRVCTPVSREWCWNDEGHFGAYVLFDWDTFFCAVMAQMEQPELAIANFRAMLEEVTPRGFVPNFGAEKWRSDDRSQPPVGAYCALKIYRASGLDGSAEWRELLKETFPALLKWHEWWMPNRDGNGNGLLAWGTDPIPDANDDHTGDKQGAMYESGLDNSPMWDDVDFNDDTHTLELDAVGLSALYAMDAWALSEIAWIIGEDAEAERLGKEYIEVSERINALMWDEEAGIYKNLRWDGALSPHLSPTCFYPMIAGIVPEERAQRMMREHLANPAAFWGEYVIPSISRGDPAYADQEYWRGRVWAPMNFLVAEGLRRHRYYDNPGHAFALRGLKLFLKEWQEEGHVHENYNAETGDGDDVRSSNPVYTWGALLAYIAMTELADAEPWAGWRFGTLSDSPASLRGIRTADGVLDVKTGIAPDGGMRVMLDGELLFESEDPVIITDFHRNAGGMSFRVNASQGTETVLTVGTLPPQRTLSVRFNQHEMRVPTDAQGRFSMQIFTSDIVIAW